MYRKIQNIISCKPDPNKNIDISGIYVNPIETTTQTGPCPALYNFSPHSACLQGCRAVYVSG